MASNDYRIVRYIEANAPVPLASVAEECGVRERTARSYIQRANAALEGIAHISWNRNRGGYAISVDDEAAFESWKRRREDAPVDALATPQGRIACLLEDLLQRDSWITLDELSEAFFVSRTSISSDLREAERRLGDYGLSLIRRPHYGIRVEGPEMARRLCLAAVAMESSDGAGRLASSHLDKNALEAISRCVEGVTGEEGYQINSVAYRNLIVHIAIAIMRIREGDYVPMDTSQMESLYGTSAYEVAGKIAAAVGKAFDCELPEEEVAYMAIHLAGKRLYSASDEGDQVISGEIWDLVSEMIEVVNRVYHYDFREDLELRMNLARHIVPLSVRLKYHLAISNPILSDIKARFPFAYSLSITASTVLAEHYGRQLSEDEMGYIAFAFAIAIDRKRTSLPKKRILIVCASGRGSAKLLEHRYRREFGPYLESVEACDAAQVAGRDFSKIDYVFTTVPLRVALPVPVCEVKYFMDVPDIERVRDVLEGDAGVEAERFLDPDLFFPHLACSSKQEAIEVLCRRVRERTGVSDDLEKLVWEREEAGPTAFGNQVAMPHPMQPVSDRTFAAVGLLDEPVQWSGHEVRAVFLLIISRDDHDGVEAFYEAMAALFIDSAAIRRLLDSQTFDTLTDLIRQGRKGA